MKKTFTWSAFPKEFLLAVLQSEAIPEDKRVTEDIHSALWLSGRMGRVFLEPDITFVRTFRKEMETHILSDPKRLTELCRKLKEQNYAGISTDNIRRMQETLFALPLNQTITGLYLKTLQRIGCSLDDSHTESFFRNEKRIDLSMMMPTDIALEDYQKEAVANLQDFYQNHDAGILVMPTGSGKTRTSVYFLLRFMIAQGNQIIWLAHRSMLLEQTASAFYRNAALLRLADAERDVLKLICISGEHCSIHHADASDDVIIGSVQSLSGRTDTFPYFLRDKVMIVVDEAHHTVAPSYRTIIEQIQEIAKDVKLLGITATPVRTAAKETPQLMKLYHDQIIYQISMGELIADEVLCKPIFERVNTDFEIEMHIDLNEAAYIRKWGELSPELVNFVANVTERNELIVNTYLNKRRDYGKTLIFAMNAVHCMSLCELFLEKGVQCDYVYSGEPNNAEKIRRFRNGELEVLININILTEGSDIPDIQTVFITRPTQSDVLLMQMIGRGMRGKAFGGTSTVNIVDFCDKWEQFNKWLNPEFLFAEAIPFEEQTFYSTVSERLPWGMFRDLLKAISFTYGAGDEKTLVSLPVGWYEVKDAKIIVFEDQLSGYENIMQDYRYFLDVFPVPGRVIQTYFCAFGLLPSENDVQIVLREIRRTGKPLKLHRFAERSRVDAVFVAQPFLHKFAPAVRIDRTIMDTYTANAALIDRIYGGKDAFRKAVYDVIITNGAVPVIGTAVKELPDEVLPYKRQAVYSVTELRDEVIAEMFTGKADSLLTLQKDKIPEIAWTDKPYASYFGVYYADQNFIRVNALLNSPSVPRECVKFIIYHELLHTKIFYHTKEFRRLERLYPDAAAHNHFLDDTFSKFDFSAENKM